MKIETVKYSGSNYLVNGSINIPSDPRNSDYQSVQKWIANGGIVEEEFTTTELKNILIVKIKVEASRRIESAYPTWQQTNYMAAVAEIHNKEIVAMKTVPFIAQYTLTADELQTVKNAAACKAAITAIRVKSNDLERSLDNMTLDELKRFDPTNDSNWE